MESLKKSKVVKIRNNQKCNKVLKIEIIQKFFYNLVQAYKKTIQLLENFILLINNLINKTFCTEDNEKQSRQIIINAIYSIYNNIIMIFTSSINNIQLTNISTTIKCLPGFKIYNKEINCNLKKNIYFFINSFRIQYYEQGVIKIVYNDINNLPENILFIGNKENNIQLIKESIIKAIRKLKIIQMNYIQVLNNLQNLVNNSSLKI